MEIRANEIDLKDAERFDCFPSVTFNCKVNAVFKKVEFTTVTVKLKQTYIIIEQSFRVTYNYCSDRIFPHLFLNQRTCRNIRIAYC